MTKNRAIHLLLLAFVMAAAPACLVTVRHPEPVVEVYGPPVEYGYQPILYNGYVVYYTDEGIPFYWANGYQVWVPAEERVVYIDHWNRYRDSYHTWYVNRGREYREHYYRPTNPNQRHNVRPTNNGQRYDNRPVIRPRDEQKPTIRPHEEKPKPVIRPKDDDDEKKKTIHPK